MSMQLSEYVIKMSMHLSENVIPESVTSSYMSIYLSEYDIRE